MAVATMPLSKNAYSRIGEKLYSLYEEEYGEDKDLKKKSPEMILEAYAEKGSKSLSSSDFGQIRTVLKDYMEGKDPALSKMSLNSYLTLLDDICRLHGLNR